MSEQQMKPLDAIRAGVTEIEHLVSNEEEWTPEGRQRIYSIVMRLIFEQIGSRTNISPETKSITSAIGGIKSITDIVTSEKRELNLLEEEIIRDNAKSLLLALKFS